MLPTQRHSSDSAQHRSWLANKIAALGSKFGRKSSSENDQWAILIEGVEFCGEDGGCGSRGSALDTKAVGKFNQSFEP